MTTERQAQATVDVLRAHQTAYRRLAVTTRAEGQAARDPYLMGKACAYLEAADALEGTILTLEQRRPRQ